MTEKKKGQHGGPRPNSGRPRLDSSEKRKNRVYTASDDEYEIIRKKAEKLGLTPSEYVREKALQD